MWPALCKGVFSIGLLDLLASLQGVFISDLSLRSECRWQALCDLAQLLKQPEHSLYSLEEWSESISYLIHKNIQFPSYADLEKTLQLFL